ncbi:MAG: OmpA family protein [Nannocystales bacterium]
MFQLTGRYETSGGAAVSVCLNQAGNFVALWISRINEKDVVHYVGSGEQPNFTLYEPDNLEKSAGTMGPGDGKTHDLALEFDTGSFNPGGPWKLSRYSRRPTLSDRALAQLGTSAEAKIARRLEHSPLNHEFLEKITERLTGSAFADKLDYFFEQEIEKHGLGTELKAAGDALNTFLGNIATGHKTSFFARRADYQRHMLRVLRTRSWTSGRAVSFGPNSGASSTRPLYDWLMAVVAIRSRPPFQVAPAPPYGYDTNNFHEDFLGLPKVTDEMKYEYEFKLQQTGVAGDLGVGVGVFKGELEIRQTKPERQEKSWSYVTMVVGVSFGFSGGVTLIKDATGVGRSHFAWTEADFLGRANVFEEGTTTAIVGGISQGTTTWSIRSAAGPGVMDVDFGSALVVGAAVGKEAGEAIGYIRQDDDALRNVVVKAHSTAWDGYHARYRGTADAHFDLGSAQLTPQAIRTLGYTASAELAALQRGSSKMMIIGTADRVDRAWYNQLLSRLRAENVAQVFDDCLGLDLKASVDTYGLGETPAEHAGDADDTENPKYRRVLLVLDGHSIARLQVARP